MFTGLPNRTSLLRLVRIRKSGVFLMLSSLLIMLSFIELSSCWSHLDCLDEALLLLSVNLFHFWCSLPNVLERRWSLQIRFLLLFKWGSPHHSSLFQRMYNFSSWTALVLAQFHGIDFLYSLVCCSMLLVLAFIPGSFICNFFQNLGCAKSPSFTELS